MSRRTLFLTVVVLALWAAPAQAATSCAERTGRVYKNGPVGVYLVKRGETWVYQLCSASLKRPTRFFSRPYEEDGEGPIRFGLRSGRLFIEDFVVSTQRTVLSWVGLADAKYRRATVPRDVEYDEMTAIATDGSIVFATLGQRGHTIWVAREDGDQTLARPRVAVRVVDGDIIPGGLAFAGGVIRWRTDAGTTKRAFLTARDVTVSSAPVTCDGRDRVYRRGRTTVVQRMIGGYETFFFCSRWRAAPRRFLEKNPYAFPPLSDFRESGETLRFTIGPEGDEDDPNDATLNLRTGRLTGR